MSEIGLGALGMVMPSVSDGSTGSAEGYPRSIPLIAATVSKFCEFIDNLIKGGKDLSNREVAEKEGSEE